jgi:hypothetical protein
MSRENRGRDSDIAMYIFVFWDAIRMQPSKHWGMSAPCVDY